MKKKPIDIAIAKQELSRINDFLPHPHLLIGGLAVQQYNVARSSKDIDLVCEFEVAQQILELYSVTDWTIFDATEDEYRPSYRIQHRIEDRGEIIFGPKIIERSPYNHISWHELVINSKPFKYQTKRFENILVPSAASLAFTKILSFIGRVRNSTNKAKQDLKDFIALSNHKEFSIAEFCDIIRKSGAEDSISNDFGGSIDSCYLIEGCSVFTASYLLGLQVKTPFQIQECLNKILEPIEQEHPGDATSSIDRFEPNSVDFLVWFLQELSRFRMGIEPHQFMHYILSFYPYRWDPADPFEGFLNYIGTLYDDDLILNISKKYMCISKKGYEFLKKHRQSDSQK